MPVALIRAAGVQYSVLMDTTQKFESPAYEFSLLRIDFVYAALLFALAAAVLSVAVSNAEPGSILVDVPLMAFFLVFSLFTISVGFPHPSFGHVSFDRVSQVSAILVLGPLNGSLVIGLSSLLYPWHRLAKGVSRGSVVTAALHNAGMMTLLSFTCGTMYAGMGGQIPLAALNWSDVEYLLVLAISMQVLNDLGMAILYFVRGGGLHWMLSFFTTGIELGSTVIAVLVAIVFVRLEISVFVLLLTILSVGMMFLKKFAEMRFRLEALVDYRTRQLRIKSRELQQQATHDTLTGLFNRRYADEYLQQQLSYARRHNTDFALALADVDNFKQINDSYSHAVGDEVLRRIADLLTQRCRNSDMISRYGGEEFLICFPSTDKNKAEEICSQLRAAVESTDWASIAENLQVTISFGVAETDAGSHSTTILNTADARLYEAKGGGRNRVVA